MNRRWIVNVSTLVISMVTLLVLLGGIGSTALAIAHPRVAAPLEAITPTVTAVDPEVAFNDLETSVVITGADFTAEFSDTLVLTSPTAYLGSVALTNVTWADSTTLTATVPWGVDPGVYTLTVVNPDGGAGSLTNAFTITQGVGQWNGGSIFGGAVRQILLKPGDPNTLYASAAAVGLFRSRDAGEHWNFINGFMGTKYVVDPSHPSWLYTPAYNGLFRSQDEGDTWTKLMNTWPDGRSIDQGRVYVSPHNPQVLFFSSAAQLGSPPAGALGLIKSTDGGASWNIVADMEGISVQDVDFHPTDPVTMVLATQAGQVFQSTDGGDHWGAVTKPPISNVGSITYNPYKPSEVWITFGGDTGIYKSTDAAFTSWQNVTPAGGQIRDLWLVKFTSADSVYTIRQHSEDGGLTWHLFGPVTSYGEMSFNPDNLQIGYIGDDTYGVQKTIDGGQTWEIKSQGLAGLSAYAIDVSRADPLRVFATFEHWPGIYRSEDGANNWTFLPIDGSANVRVVREDPSDPQRIYVAADSGFYVSTNGGETWSDLGWSSPVPWKGIMPYVMEPDPYQPGHLLAGFEYSSSGGWTGQLYSSSNYGVSWTPITVTQNLAWIGSIAFQPETPGLVYLSSNGTGLYQSTDSGNIWVRIDDLQQPDMQSSGSIAIATHPQHILFVGGNTPFRSLDGGATWEPAQSPGGVFAYMFLAGDSNRLYAATWFGLFFSSDAGTTWQRAAGVLGNVHVTAMDYAVADNYTILYAATSGGSTGLTGSMVGDALQDPLAAASNLVEAGIYRYVRRTWQTFLPLVRRNK